jgi:hypothetical protein
LNIAGRERLLDARRSAEMAALAKARRTRLREIALVEQYLAQIRWNQGSRSRTWSQPRPAAWLVKRPDSAL